MASVRLQNVSKHYGQVKAVSDITLNVNDGEFMVLLGPSGCGKTTILRLIAGLTELTSGEIYMDGKPVSHLPPGKRDVAMVFQNFALYPHMTVENNLTFGMKIRKVPAKQRREKLKEVARILRIENLLKRFPRELSGGQMQRVALGRALIRNPKVFLMDEPLSNLDPALRVTMRAEIAELHKRFPVTTLYVTHDQVEAMTMGDRIAVLNDGKLVQVGTPRQVYESPTNVFTASFIGNPPMNLIPMNLVIEEEAIKLSSESVSLTIPINKYERPPAHHLRPAQKVILGIRPDQIHLSGIYQQNCLKSKIKLVEELGREVVIHLECLGQELKVVSQGVSRYRPGETVYACIDVSKCFLFEAQTGNRILGEGNQE